MKLNAYLKKLVHNETARKGALFAVFSFFNRGLGFILLILLAGFINPEGYGYLNLFNLLVTLVSYFICFNSLGVVSVNYFSKQHSFRTTINAIAFLTLCGAVFFCLVIIFSSRQIQLWTGLSKTFQMAVLIYCVFNVVVQINLEIWRIQEKIINYGLYTTSLAILNFILTILFVVFMHKDWAGRVYAQLIVTSIFFIISLTFLIKNKYLFKEFPSKESVLDCCKFGIPLIPHDISFWLRQGLDRIVINNYYSAAYTGLFSFSLNIASIIQILGDAFNATNSVFIYRNLANSDVCSCAIANRLRRQTIMMIAFFAIVTMLICVFPKILIPIFLPQYNGATKYLTWHCLGCFFQCVYLQFVNYIFFFKKTKVLMCITFSISILHAVLSVFLTKYSIMYTVYIGVISSFLIMICVFFYSRRLYKVI